MASIWNLDTPCGQKTWASAQPSKEINIYYQSCIVLGSYYLTIASVKLLRVFVL